MEDTQSSDFRVHGDVLRACSLARLFSRHLDYCLLGKHSGLVTRRLLSESHRICGDEPYTEGRFT